MVAGQIDDCFTSAIAWLGVGQLGKRENFNEDADVYTVRADGSDLRRLTNFAPTRVDRGAPVQAGGRVAGWTRDGRIVFTVHQWAGDEGDSMNLPPEVWIMDANGANARQLDGSSLAALNEVGCVDCPYPPGGLELTAFWRPAPWRSLFTVVAAILLAACGSASPSGRLPSVPADRTVWRACDRGGCVDGSG